MVSNEAAVLQVCKHIMCRTCHVHRCLQHRQCMPCQRCERLCAAERLIQSYLSLLVSQTPPLCSDASPPQPLGDAVVIENFMHADQIIIIFYIYIFIFCSLYLLLFLIVLYRTIVTVYSDNMVLYNYLWQMHQIIIIHLSPVGCFTPARGRLCKKIATQAGLKILITKTFILNIQMCYV